ncbi:hypothetical protein [Burkholderia sp. PAMC 26561]|uniref:hypothetical protein n=1 Tax=Burkholderia sp. PAMC 26561 TaxID=1795043 RepID=UPI00084D4C7F|nr:hypothetical protein [Burkholderia sp. PAMC 26561]
MAGPITKAANKKPSRLPQTKPRAAPARVGKHKAAVAAVDNATDIGASEVYVGQANSNDASTVVKKPKRTKKEKVVRDSFTMPKSDYEKIAALKQQCADNGVTVKKSELLRAGLIILARASDEQLVAAVAAVEAVKTGRPANA